MPDFARRNEAFEKPGMIAHDARDVALGVELRELRGAELLDGHHAAEAADGLVMERILENLPDLVEKRVFGDRSENGDILRCVLDVDGDLIGVACVLRGDRLHERIENRLLAREVVVKRRRLDADGLRDFADADRIVALAREQRERLVQNFLLCVFLLHTAS